MATTWGEIERNYTIQGGTGTGSSTLTASGGSATDYPLDNLKDWARWRQWKSGATGAQSITIDMGTFCSPNAIAIGNHNMNAAAWTTVKLQHSPDGSTWTDCTTLFDSGWEHADDYDYFKKFTLATKRYWKLVFGGATLAPMIGILCLGRWFGYQEADHGGMKWQRDYNIDEFRSDSETVFAEQRARLVRSWGYKRSALKWGHAFGSESPIDDLHDCFNPDHITGTLNLHQGSLYPFFYIPRPDSGGVLRDGEQGACFYARWPSRHTLSEAARESFSDEFNIVEEL